MASPAALIEVADPDGPQELDMEGNRFPDTGIGVHSLLPLRGVPEEDGGEPTENLSFLAGIGCLVKQRVIDPGVQALIQLSSSALQQWPEDEWPETREWVQRFAESIRYLSFVMPEYFSHPDPAGGLTGSTQQLAATMAPEQTTLTTRDRMRHHLGPNLRKQFYEIEVQDNNFWEKHLLPIIRTAESE